MMLEQVLSTAEACLSPHVLVGLRVRIGGLEGRADLNGKVGTATRFAADRDRYEVALAPSTGPWSKRAASNGPVVGVRGVNLTLAEAPMVTCPICMDVEMTDPLGPAKDGPAEGCATVTNCCGKAVCPSCHEQYMARNTDFVGKKLPPCPFCKSPTGYFDEAADDVEMRSQLKRRASQADPIACYNLSGSFDAGRLGLPVDYRASAAWAAVAAMAGPHVRAMNNLAFALRDGEGVKVDHRRALAWFRRAAEMGHVGSVWAMGKACAEGLGLPLGCADVDEAAKWFARGAEMGDYACQFDLARLQR